MLLNQTAAGFDTEPLELLSLSAQRGMGKVITARNYVGTIVLKDGTQIEILPKIYSAGELSEQATKRVFLNMLRTLRDMPFKTLNRSSLHVEQLSVLDIFIRMFLDEVFGIVKRGLKAAYVDVSDNEHFVKGHILFSEHIRRNVVHRERTFCEYDCLSVNRPENRLIKTTLLFLRGKTASNRNKRDLQQLLMAFDDVEVSNDILADVGRCVSDRNVVEYDTILRWCRVFLLRQSFTTFAGGEVAYALLFPMELLFESYVAAKLQQAAFERYTVKAQEGSHYLFDLPNQKFLLKPDITMTDRSTGGLIILDTKWKLLSATSWNWGISQADMYQMYAYQKRHEAKKVLLLYPQNEMMADVTGQISYQSSDGVQVQVCLIDLMHMDESLTSVLLVCDEG